MRVTRHLLVAAVSALAILACTKVEIDDKDNGKDNTEEVQDPVDEPTDDPTDDPSDDPSDDPTTPVLTSIVIETMPEKLEYEVGEQFDTKGMVVKAVYSDSSSVTLSNTKYKWYPSGTLLAGTTEVIISYQGKEVSVPITVKEPVVVTPVLVNFVSEALQTKTAFGTLTGGYYPILWTDSDLTAKVRISSSATPMFDVNLKRSDENRTVSFSVDIKDETTEEIAFKVLSPASSALGFNATEKAWNVKIPESQTPSASSVDPAALIIDAWTPVMSMGEIPDPVTLDFHHVTAYGLLNITNMPEGAGDVSKITLTFAEKVVGKFFYDDGTHKVNSGTNSIAVTTSSLENVWFGCAPAQIAGTELKVAVVAANGVYEKTVTLPEDITLEAGAITPVNVDFTGVTANVEMKYKLVKSVTELTDKCEVLIVATDYAKSVSSTQSATYRAGVDVTITNGVITNPDTDLIQVFTIGNDGSGSYTFHTGNNYIGASKDGQGNYYFRSMKEENAAHLITIDASTGDATIAKDEYTLRYNANKDRFNVFKEGMQPVQLYKKVQ